MFSLSQFPFFTCCGKYVLSLNHTHTHTHTHTPTTGPLPLLTMQLKEQQITDCAFIIYVCVCVCVCVCVNFHLLSCVNASSRAQTHPLDVLETGGRAAQPS